MSLHRAPLHLSSQSDPLPTHTLSSAPLHPHNSSTFNDSLLDGTFSLQPPQKWNAALHLFRHLASQLHIPAIDKEFYYFKFVHQRSSANWYALLHLIEALEEHKRRTCLVLKAIREREKVVKKLRALAQKYERREKSILYVQSQGMRLFQKLQMTSLKVVELVIFWRQTLTRPWAFRMNLCVEATTVPQKSKDAAKSGSANRTNDATKKRSKSNAPPPTTNTIITTNYLLHMLDDAKWLDKSCLSFILPVKLTNTPLLSAFATLGQIKLSKRQRGGSSSVTSTTPLTPLNATSTKNQMGPQLDNNALQLTRRLHKAERIIQEESKIQRNLKKHLQQLLFNGYFVPVLNTPQIVEECYTGVEIDQHFRPEYHEMLTQFRENIIQKQAAQKDSNLLISPKAQGVATTSPGTEKRASLGDDSQEAEQTESTLTEEKVFAADHSPTADDVLLDDEDDLDLDDENVSAFDNQHDDSENYDGQDNDNELYHSSMPREYELGTGPDDEFFHDGFIEGDNQVTDEEDNSGDITVPPIIEESSNADYLADNHSCAQEETKVEDSIIPNGEPSAIQSGTGPDTAAPDDVVQAENVLVGEEPVQNGELQPETETHESKQTADTEAKESFTVQREAPAVEPAHQEPSSTDDRPQENVDQTLPISKEDTNTLQQSKIAPGQIIDTPDGNEEQPTPTTNTITASMVWEAQTENPVQQYNHTEEDDQMSARSDPITMDIPQGKIGVEHLTIELPDPEQSTDLPLASTTTPNSATAMRRRSAEIHIPSGSPVTPLSAFLELDDHVDDIQTPRDDEF